MYWAIRLHLANKAGGSGFVVVVTRFADFAKRIAFSGTLDAGRDTARPTTDSSFAAA
jgi:hypothetical protein